MITVSIGTDILDALALTQEQPEAAIMTRPPIDRRTAHLVDWRVVVQAYGILGSICTFSAFLCQFLVLPIQGPPPRLPLLRVTWGSADPYTCSADASVSVSLDDQTEFNLTAQSIYFIALIVVNWFQVMATRTRYASIVQHNPLWGPGRNLWLFASIAWASAWPPSSSTCRGSTPPSARAGTRQVRAAGDRVRGAAAAGGRAEGSGG